MCFQLRDALRVGCIMLHEDFFSVSIGAAEALKVMDDELRNYCIVTEPPKTTFGKVTPVILRRYSRTQRLHHGALRRCARLIRENSTENRTTYASRSN